MSWWLTKTIIYQSILLTGSVTGLIHFKKMDKASKVLVFFIVSTFVAELAATFFALKYHNNIFIFHIYNPIQILLLSLYFNFSIEKFHKNNLGLIIGVLAASFSVINSLFIQDVFTTFNSNILIVASFLVIAMCLYSFYDLLLGDDFLDLNTNSRFWFSALLLTFWSFTFCYWLVWQALVRPSSANTMWLSVMIWTINIVCYSGFALVFLSFRKMKKV
ncbi:MAG: hypothetical protein EOP51_05660 [Sphingobacteriales bacterium]|nr:MAG: hypothetical protein EOP51_05660 [Sphingobacteriales bacterium]